VKRDETGAIKNTKSGRKRKMNKEAWIFCLSNNSDIEGIGSLLLVHCVLLPCAVCLSLSLSFLSVDEISSLVLKTEYTAVGICHADHVSPLYLQKLALTSPTSGGRSVGIVRLRTNATE
jgi:hypothetical protein